MNTLIDEEMRTLIEATKNCQIVELPIQTLSEQTDRDLKNKLNNNHRLEGAVTSTSNIAVLGFQINKHNINIDTRYLSVFPYAWLLEFGSILTISVSSPKVSNFVSRVFITKDDASLIYLAKGFFDFVFYCEGRPVKYFRATYGHLLKQAVNGILTHTPLYMHNNKTCFWQILAALNNSPESINKLAPEDRLSVGWYNDFQQVVSYYTLNIADIRNNCEFENYINQDISTISKLFLDNCLQSGFAVSNVVAFANNIFSSLDSFFSFATVDIGINSSSKFHCDLGAIARLAIQVTVRAPEITECGRKVLWIKRSIGSGIGYFEPDASSFPSYFKPEDYWHRLPHGYPCWALGELVSKSSVPVSLQPNRKEWEIFPQSDAGVRNEVLSIADCLIEESLANKKWVIPNKAIVQIPIGPFTHFEITELGSEIYFLAQTNKGEFAIITFEPDKKELVFPHLNLLYKDENDLFESIYSSLKLLFSAIIRDFWIVEQRDSVFSQKNVKRVSGIRIKNHEDGSPRIVYLPRISYTNKPSTQNCSAALDYKERAAHFVNQHFRKVGKPSEIQVLLAKKYGVDVPEGHTFVRPHERGTMQTRQIIYRSKSALKSLYSVDAFIPQGNSQWFKFEKDVANVFKTLGFNVQHKSASRNGDQGVDLYASKGDDFEAVDWIIQCKCYKVTFSIGPEKVRELHGVVSTYPSGTRGMLVATCLFSSGAKKLASELNIRLIDGNEFAKLALSI